MYLGARIDRKSNASIYSHVARDHVDVVRYPRGVGGYRARDIHVVVEDVRGGIRVAGIAFYVVGSDPIVVRGSCGSGVSVGNYVQCCCGDLREAAAIGAPLYFESIFV